MRFFDDIEVGWRRELGKHTFTAEEIKRFASRYDPQLFHIDEAEAKKSHFGALCASGWHTAAVCMRTIVDSTKQFTADMTARGEKVAKTGPSLGFSNLKWLKPVYAGETIIFKRTVLAHRPLASRPGWRLMSVRAEAFDSTGDKVIEFESAVLVKAG
jgi:acyl dehydratase